MQFSVIYFLFPTFQPLNCKNLSLPKLAIHKLYIKTNSKREPFLRELFWLLQKPFWAIWTDSCDRYCKKIQICQFICVLVHVITVGNRRFDWQIRDKVPVVQTLDITIQWISIRQTNCAVHWIDFYPVDSAIQRLNNRGKVKVPLVNQWNSKSRCSAPEVFSCGFAASFFSLRPKTCRPVADTRLKLLVAHERKPLVPRVFRTILGFFSWCSHPFKMHGRLLCPNMESKSWRLKTLSLQCWYMYVYNRKKSFCGI